MFLSPEAEIRGQVARAQKKPLIAAQYEDRAQFLTPIKQAFITPSSQTITGLTVPHHLLARDLMARAFRFASKGNYQQIVLLSPDHFNLGDSNISTTEQNFRTVFGELATDTDAVRLLQRLPLIHSQTFFYREHGVQAELPFIKYYFPKARIIVLTLKDSTPKDQLDQVVAELKKVLSKDSLIVQSTDFSHYLTPAQAEIKDAQTISILKKAVPDDVFTLNQPANIDSVAAQYLQMRLQNEFYGSNVSIFEHKNSQTYTKEKVDSSTSYILQTYRKQRPSAVMGSGEIIFTGDVMTSRNIGSLMIKRNDFSYPFLELGTFLSDADLVVGNLEGPISLRGKKGVSPYSFRSDPRVLNGLKLAGFGVVSIANNHMWDYGKDAFADTLKNLNNAGIDYAGGGENFTKAHQGVVKEINGVKFAFLAYTELLPKSLSAGEKSAGVSYFDQDQMVKDITEAKKQADIVVTMFHWGQEYKTKHNSHQEIIAHAAIEAGASLVIGHHPHVAQEVEAYKDGWIAYSLGNFVFDQNFSKDTRNGLVVKAIFENGKVLRLEQHRIEFTPTFQPHIVD